MKGKITINITKHEQIYIDGATGHRFTSKEEFDTRYKKGGIGLGCLGNKVPSEARQGEESKA